MKDFKTYFVEVFTVMAWFTLFGYIFYCTISGKKDDSIRDAWNIIVFIAGYVWARSTEDKSKKTKDAGTTTAEISASITTNPDEQENNN